MNRIIFQLMVIGLVLVKVTVSTGVLGMYLLRTKGHYCISMPMKCLAERKGTVNINHSTSRTINIKFLLPEGKQLLI